MDTLPDSAAPLLRLQALATRPAARPQEITRPRLERPVARAVARSALALGAAGEVLFRDGGVGLDFALWLALFLMACRGLRPVRGAAAVSGAGLVVVGA